ncbi:MAG: HEAT repeat domain-containing protein [Deltaproteobacteria bacterium]|nr:HEAT repeat domain-containing protein [Deltaproteobacteria bacterium]
MVSPRDPPPSRHADDPGTDTTPVKELIQSLAKLRKALRIYLPNNEVIDRLQTEVTHRLSRYFQSHPSLPLGVSPSELMLGPEVVYNQPDRDDSLAFCLYREGVRSIIFYPGVEHREIFDFLALLNLDMLSADRVEDDVVTLLWERDFENIDYMVIEELASVAAAKQPLREMLDAPHLETARTAGEAIEFDPVEMTPPVAIPVNTVTFTDDEIEKLRTEIEVEDQDILLSGIFDVLLELVFREMGSEEGRRLSETVVRMLEALYENGQFRHLAALLKRLHELSSGPFSSSPSINRLARDAGTMFSSREKIAQLTGILNLRYHGGLNDVIAYLTTLPQLAAPHLIAILPDVVHLSYRRVICEAVARIGKEHLREIGGKLDDPRPYVVRDAVYILGRIDDPGAIEFLAKTLRHHNREIRMESVGALSRYRGQNVEQLLLQMLLDQDVDVRTAALRNIVAMGSTRVVDSLISFIESEDFGAKDLTEKRRFFIALAKLAGALLVPYFGEVLARKRFFYRTKESEIKQCAVAALSSVGNDQAKAILKEAAAAQTGIVREKAIEALRTLGMRDEEIG